MAFFTTRQNKYSIDLASTRSYSYSVVDDPTGIATAPKIEVFEVRQGDCGFVKRWNDCSKDRERCEQEEISENTSIGDEYWYGWHLYVPTDFKNIHPTKVSMGQFKPRRFDRTIPDPLYQFVNHDGGYQLDDFVNTGPNTKHVYRELISKDNLRGK